MELKKVNDKIACNRRILSALRTARGKLSEPAVDHIRNYLGTCLHEQGGFVNRAGVSDPYYSVFGYTLAFVFDLPMPVKKQIDFLNSWQKQNEPDLVHAVSLLRCQFLVEAIRLKQGAASLLGGQRQEERGKRVLARKVKENNRELLSIIASYRSKDNGFNHHTKQAERGTIYAGFLVWTLFQELEIEDEGIDSWRKAIDSLQCSDGSFVNENQSQAGVTSVTSAALIMSLGYHQDTIASAIAWLTKQWMSRGGFAAAEALPVADLLSTATALLALSMAGESLQSYGATGEDFISLHWDHSGGFFGSIADMQPDSEYTYYALLALGLI
ncbi:hypothetical protein DMA11_16180 [Marinilabiliaceae bacterium JC017]|nr:hypothetical protein DMA11_16180 [Marinilabiliaceae bacterium JC017]